MVKCVDDIPCCEYDDSVVNQHLERMTQWKIEIWKLKLKKAEVKVKLDEIKNECPDEWKELKAGNDLVAATKAEREALLKQELKATA